MVVRAVPDVQGAAGLSEGPCARRRERPGRHEGRDVAGDGVDVGEGAHLRAAAVDLQGTPLAGRLHEARQDHARGRVLSRSDDVEEAQVQGPDGEPCVVEDLLGPPLGRGVAPAALRPRRPQRRRLAERRARFRVDLGGGGRHDARDAAARSGDAELFREHADALEVLLLAALRVLQHGPHADPGCEVQHRSGPLAEQRAHEGAVADVTDDQLEELRREIRQPSAAPAERSSTPRTGHPARVSTAHTSAPMNPAAPVTRIGGVELMAVAGTTGERPSSHVGAV